VYSVKEPTRAWSRRCSLVLGDSCLVKCGRCGTSAFSLVLGHGVADAALVHAVLTSETGLLALLALLCLRMQRWRQR